MLKDSINFSDSNNVTEDYNAMNNRVDALNAALPFLQQSSADNLVGTDNDFPSALHATINTIKPGHNYQTRSKGFLMNMYAEEQAKHNALISFANIRTQFVDFSKIIVRASVIAPMAATLLLAFIGGYVIGSEPLNNSEITTARVIENNTSVIENNTSAPSIVEISPDASQLTGITITQDQSNSLKSVASPEIKNINVIETESRSNSNVITNNSIVSNANNQIEFSENNSPTNAVTVKIQSQLDALQLSLSIIADKAYNNETLDSSMLNSIAGNLHAITAYISSEQNIEPSFVMNFIQAATGVNSTLASAGNDSEDLAYTSTEIAIQQGIVGAAKYLDTNPEAFVIYAANNW
jgi:hypothetical protein